VQLMRILDVSFGYMSVLSRGRIKVGPDWKERLGVSSWCRILEMPERRTADAKDRRVEIRTDGGQPPQSGPGGNSHAEDVGEVKSDLIFPPHLEDFVLRLELLVSLLLMPHGRFFHPLPRVEVMLHPA